MPRLTGFSSNSGVGLTIRDRAHVAPGRVRVRVRGQGGNYPVVGADAPLGATIVLGNATATAAGYCGGLLRRSELHLVRV